MVKFVSAAITKGFWGTAGSKDFIGGVATLLYMVTLMMLSLLGNHQVSSFVIPRSSSSLSRRGHVIARTASALLHQQRRHNFFSTVARQYPRPLLPPTSRKPSARQHQPLHSHNNHRGSSIPTSSSALFSSRATSAATKIDHDDYENLNPNTDNKFQITSEYEPTADQPTAIAQLVHQVNRGDKFSILRGCTGTGKTMVMAHTIAQLGRPTLVLCHNKTLAAQLARELRALLSKNHVQLFVSYYNYYLPESYSETTDRYTSKKSSINDELDALRHLATKSLVEHRDVVVVSSVSCIYGLGMPKSYLDASLQWNVGDIIEGDLTEIFESNLLYTTPRGEGDEEGDCNDFNRGQYQYTKNHNGSATLMIWPPSELFPIRIDFDCHNSRNKDSGSSPLHQIKSIGKGTNKGMNQVTELTIFPAKHHLQNDQMKFEEALQRIEDELRIRVKELRDENKNIEADRLSQRVSQDLLLLKETGTCPGVENYSRHFALREEGEPPDTLLDYFGFHQLNTKKQQQQQSQNNYEMPIISSNNCKSKDWLLLVDESHVTMPQLKAMYAGDKARKKRLVKHGYRLPSALDNRPLQADEFWDRVPQSILVSATPSKHELNLLESIPENDPVDMVIRPTFVCDPKIHVRPTNQQLEDLLSEIRKRSKRNERTLAMALTKRDAEDLADYLIEQGISSTYIHSGLNTHERSNALKALQNGEVDCLVGVNLLREGLDLPQVSLVAILNADSEGFLRSETALLQTIGRAARNVNGTAVLYANRITKSMEQCITATEHRRQIQLEYNEQHSKQMKSTSGSSVLSIFDLLKDQIEAEQRQQPLLDVVDPRSKSKKIFRSAPTAESDWNSASPFMDEDVTAISLPRNHSSVETDHIPSKPGVYFWKDSSGETLYIGKAKRLRSRVKSYMSPGSKHTKRIQVMLKKARAVEFILTPSDRDALILESNLIKHHQPPYNVLLKDDESYPYICATLGDAFPHFTIVPRRHQEGSERMSRYKYFGPYPHYSEINTILEKIEEVYDLRSKSFQARYGTLDKVEYHNQFQKALTEVFESDGSIGSTGSLPAIRNEYEEASRLFESEYNQCRDVVALGTSQDASTSVVHVLQLRQGLIAGQFSYSFELQSGLDSSEDYSDAIQTVLEQRHYPSGGASAGGGRFSFFPEEVLCQYPIVQGKNLKDAIRSARNHAEPDTKGSVKKISVRTVARRGSRKDADSRAMECAVANAEQVANEKALTTIAGVRKSSVDGTAAEELVSLLSLERVPERIECYDISHTQGQVAVGSRVVFINGRPAPHLYRRFNIKTVDGIDDYGSLEEVLERRFLRSWKKAEDDDTGEGIMELVDKDDPWAMPDLVVIDGGKGQLSAAIKGMAKANVYPGRVSSVAPAATEELNGDTEEDAFVIEEETYPPPPPNDDATTGYCNSDQQQHSTTTVNVVAIAKRKEKLFVDEVADPVNGSSDSPALLLLRALRDESHRFALKSHRRRRSSHLNGL